MIRSFARIFSAEVASKAMLAGTSILAIRYMMPAEYARYTLALATASIVVQALSTSLNAVYVVSIRQDSGVAEARSYLWLQFQLVLLVMLTWLPFAGHLHGLRLLVLLFAIGMLSTNFLKTLLQRELRFDDLSRVEVGRSSVFLVAVVLLVVLGGGDLEADEFLTAQTAALGLVALVGVSLVSDSGLTPDLRGGWALAKRIAVAPVRGLVGYHIVLSLLSQAGIFLLEAAEDEQAVAAYGSAFRYYLLLSLALGSIQTILFPSIQHAATDDELKGIMQGHKRIAKIFVPLVLIGSYAANWVIPLLDRGMYPTAVPTFQVLALSSIISFLLSPYSNLVKRRADFGFLFGWGLVATVAFVASSWFAVREGAEIGLAWSTLLGYALLNGGIFFKARSYR